MEKTEKRFFKYVKSTCNKVDKQLAPVYSNQMTVPQRCAYEDLLILIGNLVTEVQRLNETISQEEKREWALQFEANAQKSQNNQ